MNEEDFLNDLEKEINRVDNLIDNNLPNSINGFQLRRANINNHYGLLMYSKIGSYLGKYMQNLDFDIEHFDKNVLYEVVAENLEKAYFLLKEKLDLNYKVVNDFPKNIILNFKPNFEIISGEKKVFIKPFEIYLVLDTNSDTQFFCAVLANPETDLLLLVPVINELKKQINNNTLISLSGDDFDYSDFDLPKIIHIYSNDFKQKKENIRKHLQRNGWKVKFKDKYSFKKNYKQQNERIILCEGKNVKILNELQVQRTLFSSEHNSVSVFQNVKTQKKYALRDKDYLIDEEIIRLKQKFPKYYILNYYCIENYLYHPDNIEQLNLFNFNKDYYISDITDQKNNYLMEIVSEIKLIRKGYKELSENHIKKVPNALTQLIEELKSNDFETFYKHFDMKKKYKREQLQEFNLNENRLSKTEWFRKKLIEIIK